MNSFLPPNYELPDNSNYMKFEKGANKFRVLSNAVIGWVYWNRDGKPVRLTEAPQNTPADIRTKDGKPEAVKHFWAFVVWNYQKNKVQILEIVQASIQGPITDLVNTSDWGDPKEYDLTVTKKGEGLDTEYTVQPSPHKAVPTEASAAYREKRIDLDKLFAGTDPFSSDGEETSISKQDTPFND